jgi:predicted RNase H-like nuclease (RuvC/YqgF family)
MAITAAPKSVIVLSIGLLALATIFGALNTSKVKSLRATVPDANAARAAADRSRLDAQKARESAMAQVKAKAAENESKIAKAEVELVQLQTEKADLQTKFQANQAEIASLQKKLEETGAKPSENPGAASPAELQAQLDDARRQLESAERENAFLSDKIRGTQERSGQLEGEKKRRREVGVAKPGVRGTVLAVNQAYNFVVLNLGGRQGVEPNAEMLVLRDGTIIGKIRISSVEPSTAIGDIITSSLERGVQVQPGDIVIYAGTNS